MPGRNLKLLCLDGGGIRGLSSLYILQKLMETINPEQPPKPCEYFDIIGGTSTGGLIAILLGRLEMDVDSCIKWYIDLCNSIFANKKTLPFDWKGNVQARFKSEPLKMAFMKVIRHQGFHDEELLQKPENRCKVFVCATSGNTSTPVLFRSYPSRRDSSSLYRETKIWEAARATSAAPTFFEPICIGPTGRPFGDGGTGANNPIDEMWKEAIDICGGEFLTENLSCIVSIGTGVPNLKKFGNSTKEFVDSIVRIATQTEETANNFHHAHPELNAGQQRYFRFNAPRGLGEIGLDEASEAGKIEDMTAYYLRDENTHKQVQQCANLIAESNSARIIAPAADLTSQLIFSNIVKRPEWQLLLTKSRISLHDIFERLSSYDRYKAYRRRANYKFENTTHWILNHPDFVTWLNGEGPQCLWLTGIVGCGKSIIVTTVIDAANVKAQEECRPVLYFIYDHSFRRYLSAKSLFESCTKQLLGYIERSNKSCPSAVVSRIQEFYSPKSRRPDIQELINEILIPLYNLVESVTFLIDGLDECSRQETLDVLMGFRQLLKYPSCRVFISCREEVNVLRGLPGSICIWITPEYTKADMEIFLDKQIEERQYERPISDNQTVLDHIRHELLSKADGMFLWVRYQIKMLWEDCAGEDAVDDAVYEALKNLPKDLNETYQRCLSRVNRDSKRKSVADRVLRWIYVAIEPFRISQLQEALVVNLDTGELEHSPLQKEEVIACCANLAFLEKDGLDQLVLPAHHSVRQFLFPPTAESAFENAQKGLGELCVIHLYKHRPLRQVTKPCIEPSSDSHRTTIQLPRNIISTIGSSIAPAIFRPQPYQTPIPVRLLSPTRNFVVPEESGFLSYAINNWASLTRNVTTTSRYWTQFEELALLNSQIWNIYPWGPSRPSRDSHIFELYGWSIINRHYSLLSLAIDQQTRVKKSIFGLPLFDQVRGQALLPLHTAVELGDVRVVKLLLKISAGVNDWAVTDGMRKTPLHRAADRGHEAVVQLLLESQADVNSKNSSGWTPLHYAADRGREAVVRLLLESQADVNSKDSSGWTPLHWAADNGHEAVVPLLLESQADVNSKNSSGWMPLHWAADRGHEAVVRLLLESQADVNARDGTSWTPLHRAADRGHEAVVRLLLESQADVNARDGTSWTPLHRAADRGHEAVVRLLLESQADVNARDGTSWTPLHRAADKGHEAVVQLLLESQADVNARDGTSWTPLHRAADKGHEAVVQLLLESQADVNARDGTSWTPLHCAADNGHEAVVRLLLESQADVNSKNSSGWTPLHRAADNGHEAVVRLLLESQADVNAKHRNSWTPLHCAANRGHEAVVRLLLESQADVNAKDSESRKPLYYTKNNKAVARLIKSA